MFGWICLPLLDRICSHHLLIVCVSFCLEEDMENRTVLLKHFTLKQKSTVWDCEDNCHSPWYILSLQALSSLVSLCRHRCHHRFRSPTPETALRRGLFPVYLWFILVFFLMHLKPNPWLKKQIYNPFVVLHSKAPICAVLLQPQEGAMTPLYQWHQHILTDTCAAGDKVQGFGVWKSFWSIRNTQFNPFRNYLKHYISHYLKYN